MRGSVHRLFPTAAILVGLCIYGTGFAALKATPTAEPATPPSATEGSKTGKEVSQAADPRGAKLEILRGVASGGLSPEEALPRLDEVYSVRETRAQWISIQFEEGRNRDSVRMSFPIALGEWGLKMVAQQGREMLDMAGIRQEISRHGDSMEAILMQKALEILDSPDATKTLGAIIETLRTAPPGHVLFELTQQNQHLKVHLE
jgi:hypothetical protein